MRLWLFRIALVLIALPAAGCGQSAPAVSGRPAPAPHAFHVYLAPTAPGSSISVVDPETGAGLRTLPTGTPAPDFGGQRSHGGGDRLRPSPIRVSRYRRDKDS